MSNSSTEPVDTHSPEQLAAWLRKRAEENRRVASLPPDQWPRSPSLLQHLAFRFEQGAAIVDDLRQFHEWAASQVGEDIPRMSAEIARLRAALESLLPGLILDLRYASDDDDTDAMRSRIETVQQALAADLQSDVGDKHGG